jgi:hypothetical protein
MLLQILSIPDPPSKITYQCVAKSTPFISSHVINSIIDIFFQNDNNAIIPHLKSATTAATNSPVRAACQLVRALPRLLLLLAGPRRTVREVVEPVDAAARCGPAWAGWEARQRGRSGGRARGDVNCGAQCPGRGVLCSTARPPTSISSVQLPRAQDPRFVPGA